MECILSALTRHLVGVHVTTCMCGWDCLPTQRKTPPPPLKFGLLLSFTSYESSSLDDFMHLFEVGHFVEPTIGIIQVNLVSRTRST